jgi:hypothetical protein
VHREIIYVWLFVGGLWFFSHYDHLQRTETTTTTPDRFLGTDHKFSYFDYSEDAEFSFDANKLRHLDHLVLVAGHAVLDPHAESLARADRREDVWYLMDYQRHQDMPQVLVSHIKRGVEEASMDPGALLVFSGGQTRSQAGPHDEGSSYYRVAEHYKWWGREHRAGDHAASVAQRTVTEDFATDSFQNLLFSICRFHELVGSYPSRITVVGFSFKMHRFASLHRAALRFPIDRFRYVGIEPPRHFDLAKAELGEKRNSLRPFEADPYGCNSAVLRDKRLERNPFRRTIPYSLSCPDLRGLLEWCEPSTFPYPLPWNNTVAT